MPLDPADQSHLLDIVRHAQGAVDALTRVSLAEYQSDENLRLAIERRIEIIGEAARRLSPPLQAAHPEVPWHRIIAQRHVLAHEYGEIDDELIWRVVIEHLPKLLSDVRAILGMP